MRDCEAGDYDWAGFKAEQAAEYARSRRRQAVEERLRAWRELMEEARAYAGRIREALADSRLLMRFAQGREEPRGLTPDEFRRLAAKGALWYLEGAVRL